VLKGAEKLGSATEPTLLMDDLYHAIPVFLLPSLWWIPFYLVSVIVIPILILFLW